MTTDKTTALCVLDALLGFARQLYDDPLVDKQLIAHLYPRIAKLAQQLEIELPKDDVALGLAWELYEGIKGEVGRILDRQ